MSRFEETDRQRTAIFESTNRIRFLISPLTDQESLAVLQDCVGSEG
jgi:hypothetical protein